MKTYKYMSETKCCDEDHCDQKLSISENDTDIIEEKVSLTEEEKKKRKRKAYKEQQKLKNNSPINETNESDETKELHKLGKENLDKWESICNMVKDYREKIGRFPNLRSNGREVNDEAAKVLARWLWLQNTSYNKRVMHPYHIRRLEEIGYKFVKTKG